MGVASLILGIIGIICCLTFILSPFGLVLTIVGLILGIVDTVKKGKTGESRTLSIVSLIICALFSIILAFESFFLLLASMMFIEETVNSSETQEIISNVSDPFESDFSLDDLDINLDFAKNQSTTKKDAISGNSFVNKNDNSLLNLQSNGSFKYYRDKSNLLDNYYEGTFKLYIANDAINYITNDLSQYGIEKEELEGVFDRSDIYDSSNFCCLVLSNDKCIINGKNILSKTSVTPYYGFYLEDKEVLDIANMNTATYFYFEKQ